MPKLITTLGLRSRAGSMLWDAGGGIAGLALVGHSERAGSRRAATTDSPLAPKQPHFPPKARSVISLFMNGGASHVDTFDPKPRADEAARRGSAEEPEYRVVLSVSREHF